MLQLNFENLKIEIICVASASNHTTIENLNPHTGLKEGKDDVQ